jgi:hypothetical protein
VPGQAKPLPRRRRIAKIALVGLTAEKSMASDPTPLILLYFILPVWLIEDRGAPIGSVSNHGMLVPHKARKRQLKGGVSPQ